MSEPTGPAAPPTGPSWQPQVAWQPPVEEVGPARGIRFADHGARLLAYWIDSIALYIGFAWILIDKRRRGWHDLIAGTVVIQR